MSIHVEDIGQWERYTPDPVPEWAAGVIAGGISVAFARRVSDGKDWYEFMRGTLLPAGFALCTAIRNPTTGLELTQGVFTDPSLCFPAGLRLLEISGLDPSDPEAGRGLEQKIYDPAAKTFSEPPPPRVVSVAASQALIQLSRMPHDGSVVAGAKNLAVATEALVAQSGDYELKTWFARAQRWLITNPNVQKIGAAFKLSPGEIQAAFDAANLIEE